MDATELIFKKVLSLCNADPLNQRTGFAGLCFPSYYDDPATDHEDVFSWIPRVQIVDEPDYDFAGNQSDKFILDASQMHQIARFVLPKDLAFSRWQRLFSKARDGGSFDECLRRMGGEARTLMVVRATNGEIFGGFADAPWEHDNHEFHGSENTKVFTFTPDNSNVYNEHRRPSSFNRLDSRDDSEEKVKKEQISVFKWTGNNRFFQYCDTSRTLFAFGGGGARFGLSIESFKFGSTAPSDTYRNRPLCSEKNFRVQDFEVWGFVPVDSCCSLLCFAQDHTDETDPSWIPPVRVVPEPYRSETFILDSKQMNQIARYVLPQGIAACRWKRVYSLQRDGDSFSACLEFTREEPRSLMVIRTSDDEIFGGYADSPWMEFNCNYYGSAQSCLWTFVDNDHRKGPSSSARKRNQLKVYKWTGVNRYIQYCDVTHKILAFGGGGEAGSFGLVVEQNFQMGSTGPCATFGNAPLGTKEHFKIVDMEIYGFVTGQF